jgi:tetratricopeptide (TPR) repeat protein
MLGISERRLQSWEKQKLVPCLEIFAFSDLIALRTLIKLRQDRVPPLKIRRAVAALREKLGVASDPLKELKIFADGKRVTVQVAGSKMEPISGQLLLDFDQAELAKLLSFPQKEDQETKASSSAKREFEALLWFERALDLEQTGAPADQVIQAYRNAIELDPHSAGPLVNLGTIFFHLQNWDEAEKYYRGALEADPGYALAHFNLGNLFDEKGDRSQALLHYITAIRLNPAYSDAHYNLALLYQSSGQVMRAVRHWKAYLKLDSTSPWATVARQELEKLRRATVIKGLKEETRTTNAESVS